MLTWGGHPAQRKETAKGEREKGGEIRGVGLRRKNREIAKRTERDASIGRNGVELILQNGCRIESV